MKQSELTAEIEAMAEQSYNQLDGEWRDWLEVARRYEHKVPNQDRLDIRHDIMLELHRARRRDNKPLPLLRAYRIASLTVALYWREANKPTVKLCVFDGIAKEPHCKSCRHKPQSPRCPYLAIRPIQSLDSEAEDTEGRRVRLMDTVADDKAIDLVAKLDASHWLLGCKMQLIHIATKVRAGIELNRKEKNYLYHFRNRELKKAQKALF
ncbi:hypothetical protein ES703_106948 [subsurface metagenome]